MRTGSRQHFPYCGCPSTLTYFTCLRQHSQPYAALKAALVHPLGVCCRPAHCRRPPESLAGSAVGVARAPAASDAQRSGSPGRGSRTADVDPPDRTIAEFGVELADELGGEQPKLRRPGSRVGDNCQDTVDKSVRRCVRSQVWAHDLHPAAEYRPGRNSQFPAGIGDKAVDRGAERRRVIPTPTPGLLA